MAQTLRHLHSARHFVLLFLLLSVTPLLHNVAHAQDVPAFSIAIGEVTPPTACKPSGWTSRYDRTTTLPGAAGTFNPDLARYFVQYVDDELNLVHYWGSGYSAYVQNYAVDLADTFPLASTSYTVPLWSATYHAVTIEYILDGDDVLWEIRAELACQAGKVTDYVLTSQAAHGTRNDLPQPQPNLVLALADIPRYRLPYTQQDLLGTIHACQTFYISQISNRRASLEVSALESLTKERIMLADGNPNHNQPIVDVPEDYGQPGGFPIFDQCTTDN